MSFRFQPAKFPHGHVPDTQEYTPESSQTFIRGVVVDLTGGEIIIHPGGTTVTDIFGVALHGMASAGVSDSPSGLVAVAKADPDQTYLGQVVAGGVDEDVVLTDLSGIAVGDHYGFIINTAGEHLVDFSDTTNVVLEIEKIDDNLDIVWFKFLASAIVNSAPT